MKHFFLSLLLFLSFATLAQTKLSNPTKGEAEIAKDQLKAMAAVLETIKAPIERFNLGGWVVLRQQVDAVVETIDRNRGVGNDETSDAYKELVFQIESSKDYFRVIETDTIQKDIQSLQAMSDEIKKVRKMNSDRYSKHTLRMFTKIQTLIENAKAMPINNRLRDALTNLNPILAEVFAQEKVQGGDRPLTFEAAKKAVTAIRALYPLLSEAGYDPQVFLTVSSIYGFVEQYAFIANMAAQPRVEDDKH